MNKLEQGYALALKAGACDAQMSKLKEFIEAKDQLQAYQTVLGNIGWLRENNIPFDMTHVEKKANGIAKRWHANGQLYEKCTYKEGKLDGIAKRWHANGKLAEKCTYKEGKLDGIYESWHSNGKLAEKCTYKEGKLDGIAKRWHANGQLCVKCTYKDGETI
jgi:antitoxin component YwqK of YwqJK toxin-antitoxin module